MSNEALTMRGPVHGTKEAKRVAVGSGVGAVIEPTTSSVSAQPQHCTSVRRSSRALTR